MKLFPDFRSPEFLRAHIDEILAFYRPHALDPAGGFFHYFKDDGTVYDTRHRHLVSSTRFVVNHARAWRLFGRREDRERLEHGLRFLREKHRDPASGAYFWTLTDGRPDDRTRHAYGMAFVLLAYACALKAGVPEAKGWLSETWDLLEERFFDPAEGLYRDEADATWTFSPYRGQNANMHLCEAALAAHAASGQSDFLARAALLADRMVRRQGSLAGGFIWEHYGAGWQIDWNYNRDHPKHLFRPWGFQVGHQIEWAKLLMTLEHIQPTDWRLERARWLFDRAFALGWDDASGGLYYGLNPDGTPVDDDKYFWVQAEAIAAAAHLAVATGVATYWERYEALWRYAWEYFVDHRYGAWYRILDRRNVKYSDEKSPAGKCDYHTLGACYDVLVLIT